MSDDRDDIGTIPDPGAASTPSERAAAERLSGLVDAVLAGDKLPPAMEPDDRMLIDVAAMIRAGTGEVSLSQERAQAIANSAIARARRGARPASISSVGELVQPAESPPAVDALAVHRQGKTTRLLPWAVALIAAAAAVVVWLARPQAPNPRVATTSEALPLHQRSRPADPLIGMIARADAERASTRIDAIYADRLEGYRSLTLSSKLPRGGKRD